MRILGIDPGLPMTIGVLNNGRPTFIHELDAVGVQITKPGRKTASWRNVPELVVEVLKDEQRIAAKTDAPMVAIIERVALRPNEALGPGTEFVGSMYMAMTACVALGIKYHLVPPSVWKPALHVKVSLVNPKEPARLRAVELWPDAAKMLNRKRDHNRAEAWLLAHWYDKIGKKTL